MAVVTGTFTGTGTSDWIEGKYVTIKMDFAGSASVDVETKMEDGTVVKTADTAVTADFYKTIEDPLIASIRLNCTAHTDNVVYEMRSLKGRYK